MVGFDEGMELGRSGRRDFVVDGCDVLLDVFEMMKKG